MDTSTWITLLAAAGITAAVLIYLAGYTHGQRAKTAPTGPPPARPAPAAGPLAPHERPMPAPLPIDWAAMHTSTARPVPTPHVQPTASQPMPPPPAAAPAVSGPPPARLPSHPTHTPLRAAPHPAPAARGRHAAPDEDAPIEATSVLHRVVRGAL